MREIKFRAWTDKGEMIYNYCQLIGNRFLGEDMTNTNYGNVVDIMQFTGLYDCEGKEIYEGDILKDNIGIGEVFYCNRSASFMCMVDGKDSEGKLFFLNEGDPFRKTKLEYTKVIGNIHEAH